MADDLTLIHGYLTKYSKQLISQTLNGLDFVRDLTPNGGVITTLREELALPKVVIGEGIRPLNTSIETEKHGRSFSKRKIVPRHGMKIFKVIPEDYRETYFSAMMAPGAKREPYEAFIWAREFEKLGAELNDNFYLAKYHNDPVDWAAGDTYTAGDLVYYKDVIYEVLSNTSAGQSPESHAAKFADVDNKVLFDGPGTIIAKEITGNAITPISTGSFDHTNAVGAIQEVWGGVPQAHRAGMTSIAYVSHSVFEDYIEDYNSRYGSGNGNPASDLEEGKPVYLKRSNKRCKIMPTTWMGDSRRIIITKPGNIKVGTDQISDAKRVSKLVESLHGYKAVTKFMLTSQIADLEVLHVNDQA